MARTQTKGSKNMPETETGPKSVRLQLPADVHQQFRVEAAKEGTSMAVVARQLVEDWLKKRKGIGK